MKSVIDDLKTQCRVCAYDADGCDNTCIVYRMKERILALNDYYDRQGKQALKYLCAITKALRYLDHLRKDCKYRLNEGHLRKLQKILQEPFKEPAYLESGGSNE